MAMLYLLYSIVFTKESAGNIVNIPAYTYSKNKRLNNESSETDEPMGRHGRRERFKALDVCAVT